MRITTINSYTIFPTLKLMLKEDIKTLERVIKLKEPQGKMGFFLGSMIYAKEKIINLLPEFTNDFNSPQGSVPQKEQILSTNAKSILVADNQVQLINDLLQSEQNQKAIIKHAAKSANMPLKLKRKLKKVLSMYESIIDQLSRSKSTQQLGVIVL